MFISFESALHVYDDEYGLHGLHARRRFALIHAPLVPWQGRNAPIHSCIWTQEDG